MGSTLFGFDHFSDKERGEEKGTKEKEKATTDDSNKKLPIINPLVTLPNWPSKYIVSEFCSTVYFVNCTIKNFQISPHLMVLFLSAC